MPTVNSSQLTVQSSKKKWRGFSLIELLIVISIFGFASSIISVSYIGFQNRQSNKDAVGALKNNIRYVQNLATSGVKGNACDPDASYKYSKLAAWYIDIDLSDSSSPYMNNTYTINNLCVNTVDSVNNPTDPCGYPNTGPSPVYYACSSPFGVSSTFTVPPFKTITLSDNLSFTNAAPADPHQYIFFLPLKSDPIFCSGSVSIILSGLSSDPVTSITCSNSNPITLTIYGPDSTITNTLTVSANGSVK